MNLLSMGLSIEQIAKATGLSAEDIRVIQAKK
jgi:predicted transposase YdaD